MKESVVIEESVPPLANLRAIGYGLHTARSVCDGG
jgi:hypothetical protein